MATSRLGVSRRDLFRSALLVAGGAAVGAAAPQVPKWLGHNGLPLYGGYAAAADPGAAPPHPGVAVTYRVQTDERVVAFTFDDGPGPLWTKMVLDVLDDYAIPATFFVVGQNLAAHADLVRGRLDRHLVGNHSWSHPDLAQLDAAAVRDQLSRTHDVIAKVTGRQAHLLRPPYGHLAGSTVLAADQLAYDLVLWSHQMHEAQYQADPSQQVREIVENVTPGAIVLAHDVGRPDRLVALNHLGEMFAGLKARGFRFVTVDELIALGRVVPHPS